ncbi:MAG: CoA pyrophosphatase [Archaeoglobaceae archaeon]|nr:CoA pyrophosphatase [Archaeoglobaceae archaeon]MDW8117661.1 CoA pyrophosphatase [Archaeoglobaceae archaeon]
MLKVMLKEILSPKLDGEVMAAVLVPILDCREPKILMIKRGENLTRNAGHVAFPGGMREEGEDVVETALREFEEELGVGRKKIEIVGFLKSREVREYKIPLSPIVGITDEREFKPDTREVSKILVDSLEKVLKSRRIADWGPNFECSRELVWGASSRVLEDLYMRIVFKYGSIDDFFKKLRDSYGTG